MALRTRENAQPRSPHSFCRCHFQRLTAGVAALSLLGLSCDTPSPRAAPPDAEGAVSLESRPLFAGSESLIPEEIKWVAAQFEEASEAFTKAKDAYELVKKAAMYLGFIAKDDPNAPFNSVKLEMQNIGRAINVADTLVFIGTQRGKALFAIDRIQRNGGMLAEGSNEDQSSAEAANAISDPGKGAFLRPYSAAAVDDVWTSAIPVAEQSKPDSNNLVYDWRLGVPAMMEVISHRIHVIAAMDPNFRWNDRYDSELIRLRNALKTHHDIMLAGIKCVLDAGGRNSPMGLGNVCADIYTGAFDIDITIDSSINHKIQQRLASNLKQKMPLFELRSMIDTLTLYINGQQDLSEAYGDIRLRADQSLCLEAIGARPPSQTPMQLFTCHGDVNQWWSYDRSMNAVWNPFSGHCLDVKYAGAEQGTPVWTYECNGTNAQKWTWDPDTGVLQNALGTVLDVQWGQLWAGIPVWTWPLNGGLAQQWHAPQTCLNVCAASDSPVRFNACNQTCADKICAVDPYCCEVSWDSICVDEVRSVCGLKC